MGVPEVTDVAATQEDKGNSVAVEYAFEKTPYTYKSLKIEFNKARQTAITQEITEIVAASKAI